MDDLEEQLIQALPISADHPEPWEPEPTSDDNFVQTISPGLRGGTDRQGNVLAFTLTDDQSLLRFLILGTDGGTYYTTEAQLLIENLKCLENLIKAGQGEMVVQMIVNVVKQGRSYRMNAPLMALAYCCRCSDKKTKVAAFKAFSDVCSIPTHLFKLIGYLEKQGQTTGWGRGLRKAVSVWYNNFVNDPRRLAMLITKYRQREGWSHRDLMRLCHLKPADPVIGFIICYAVKGLREAKKHYLEDGGIDFEVGQIKPILQYLEAVDEVRCLQLPSVKRRRSEPEEDSEEKLAMEVDREKISDSKNEDGEQPIIIDEEPVEESDVVERRQISSEIVGRVIELIQQYDLLREHLPPFMLSEVPVWAKLLEKMPLTALVRNLNKMTMIGLLDDPDNLARVLDKLGNAEALKMARVHPVFLLNAWCTYAEGRGLMSKLRWTPNAKVVDALVKAFYSSFGNVKPTNKRILIALDCSGSMTFESIRNTVMKPNVAAAAMCMVTAAVETNVDLTAFSVGLTELDKRRTRSLEDFVSYVNGISPIGTNCGLPMLWAAEKGKKYDAFIIYTDSETWHSTVKPADALQQYRQKSGIADAKLVVVAMTSNKFTIADPADLNMLDVVGFDTETPNIIQQFISGTLYDSLD